MADIDSFKKDIQSLVKKFAQEIAPIASVSRTPIRTIHFNNPSEKSIHDKIVSLVERMLNLHKNKIALPLSAEREKLEREITITVRRSG